MAGRYKPYPEYKDSEVEWLEDIPAHWSVRRTKAMFSLRRDLVGKQSADYQLLSLTLRGVVTRDISDGGGKIPAEFDTYQVVCPQDLIFCLFDIDETPRTIGLSSNDGMITGAYNVYRCLDSCVPEYAYYYFMHIDSFKGLKPFYTGLRKVVRSETFSNIKIPAPSLLEQSKIANFLDHETAKIDTLIEKQQQLIQLLKEKRQAVISHAVTKGLNPNAKMKDSGVEWLGEVPEGWEIKNIGKISEVKRGSGYQNIDMEVDGKENIGMLRISDMHSVEPVMIVKNNEVMRYTVQAGDILVAGTGATAGISMIIETKDHGLVHSYNSIMVRIKNKEVVNKFVHYFLCSEYISSVLDVSFVGSAQPFVDTNGLRKLPILMPDYFEQMNIVNYIDEKLKKLSDLFIQAEFMISMLQERRTALISAAVTGKIDVRGWQAPQDGK